MVTQKFKATDSQEIVAYQSGDGRQQGDEEGDEEGVEDEGHEGFEDHEGAEDHHECH